MVRINKLFTLFLKILLFKTSFGKKTSFRELTEFGKMMFHCFPGKNELQIEKLIVTAIQKPA